MQLQGPQPPNVVSAIVTSTSTGDPTIKIGGPAFRAPLPYNYATNHKNIVLDPTSVAGQNWVEFTVTLDRAGSVQASYDANNSGIDVALSVTQTSDRTALVRATNRGSTATGQGSYITFGGALSNDAGHLGSTIDVTIIDLQT